MFLGFALVGFLKRKLSASTQVYYPVSDLLFYLISVRNITLMHLIGVILS